MTTSDYVTIALQVFMALGIIAGFIQNRVNARKIEVVHRATNSMKDELVAAVREEAFQAGKIDQASQQKVTGL